MGMLMEFHFREVGEHILLYQQKPTELELTASVTSWGIHILEGIRILKPDRPGSSLGSTAYWLGASQNLGVFISKRDIIIPTLQYSY